MKNLEKFNAETTPLGTQLITRDGMEVSEWYYFKTNINRYQVTAIVNGVSYRFMKDGKIDNGIEEHSLDLFIKPKVREIWVNVYRSTNGNVWVGDSFNTKQQAIDNKADSTYIKTIRITDEPE